MEKRKNKPENSETGSISILNRNIYPFLFALYPVLFMYSNNIKEVRFTDIFLPIVCLLTLTVLVMKGFGLWLKDKDKGAFIAFLFLFFFFMYTPVSGIIDFLGLIFGIADVSGIYSVVLLLILWGTAALLAVRTQKKLTVLKTILNVASSVLLLFNIFNIATFEVGQLNKTSSETTEIRTVASNGTLKPTSGGMPDIYHIVLDEYSGFDGIKKIYGYDNDRFAQQLEQRGFYVARQSRSRYYLTEKSMGAILNMRHLQKDEDPHQLLRDNKVTTILKELGYQIIVFPITRQTIFQNSDTVYGYSLSGNAVPINEFHLFLLKHSMLNFLYQHLVIKGNYSEYYRNDTLYILNKMKKVPEMDLQTKDSKTKPKFVYAHIHCPHFPFVFDENGENVPPDHITDVKVPDYYLGQYKFITNQTLGMIDALLEKSTTPPVIILQSDHGQRGFAPGNGSFRVTVGDDWHNVLNCYYLPDIDKSPLHPSFSPVDTYALVFNGYFNGRYSFVGK